MKAHTNEHDWWKTGHLVFPAAASIMKQIHRLMSQRRLRFRNAFDKTAAGMETTEIFCPFSSGFVGHLTQNAHFPNGVGCPDTRLTLRGFRAYKQLH